MQKTINDIEIRYNNEEIVHYDRVLNYIYTFNTKTGVSIRSAILEKGFVETEQEVFAARFPHLIDVGIMGHCTHGKSGLCLKSGVQCYQDGFHVAEDNMSLFKFKKIAEECNGLTNQFALGGRGDPNEHEQFEEILKTCQINNIVPNYTTSGFCLTDKQIEISKRYCGAVAVSWYRSEYTISAITRLVAAGIKTNIHYVLNTDTIDEALLRLKKDSFPLGINAVVFLTHKPIGLGEKAKCINSKDPRLKELIKLIKTGGRKFKIGVDGCLVVGMISSNVEFDTTYLDACGACRFTCYISPSLMMSPCSFNKRTDYQIDINNISIWDAWNGNTFDAIRKSRINNCPKCDKRNSCFGGCFLYDETNLCASVNRGV